MCGVVFVVGAAARGGLDALQLGSDDGPSVSLAGAVLHAVGAPRPAPRTVDVHRGPGVWVDAFDFSPAYQGGRPRAPVTPDHVADFGAAGVQTLYLQAARSDERSPGRLLEEDLLGEFLVRAHAAGIRVVAWYLPTFVDVDVDLDHLVAMATFTTAGHRFDGIAVDIEYTEGVEDVSERSRRLVELSRRLRDARPDDAIAAIVPPAVQMEVINPGFWPGFPWAELAPLYDVWQPMAYFTLRSTESGYRDAYAYTMGSIRRMRSRLGLPDALVHPIAGIADAMSAADFAAFARAVTDSGSIGASVYDWNTLSPVMRPSLATISASRGLEADLIDPS